jgi:hypothetical protein
MEQLVASGALEMVTGFGISRLDQTPDGIVVGSTSATLAPVDEIIASTGFRPDLSLLSELRLNLDPSVEAPVALAPLIDPNIHSCGSVPPHGVDELSHPEPGRYMVGMKSYGRAPTFLLLTGYEQVRSIAAALGGDWIAAREVRLVLPETGVCSSDLGNGCCEPATGAGTTLELVPLVAAPLQRPRNIELLPVAAGACCTPAAQATCCDPEAKADCCGADGTACGC